MVTANLEDMVKVLHPLSIFTDALSGEKHVTISAVRPLLDHILKKIVDVQPSDRPMVKQMKEKISEDLSNRYSSLATSLLDKCSFLDPRFRCKFVTDREEVLYQIKEEAVSELESFSPPRPMPTDHDIETESTEEARPPVKKKKLKGLSAILQHCVEPIDNEDLSCEEKVEKEGGMRSIHQCLLTRWWEHEEQKFPNLKCLARKYLCICGTSVPSERLFLRGGTLSLHNVIDFRQNM